jgi:plastocyanin
MKRLTLTFGLLALAVALAACSGASAEAPTPAAPAGSPSGDGVTIVAKDIKFVPTAVSVKADTAFDLVFDNQDGAPHNIDISSSGGTTVFKGEIVTSSKVTYAVPALPAGTYGFVCDVHPEMKGTITAQ